MILRWRRANNCYWCVADKKQVYPPLDHKMFPRWVWEFWRRVNPQYGRR